MTIKCLRILILIIYSTTVAQNIIDKEGAVIRSDMSKKEIYFCFTGHEFNEGFNHVLNTLDKHQIKGSFFLTGDFIRSNKALVQRISKNGHFVGAHSDQHLLYCDWSKRDSLLHTPQQIKSDIINNLDALKNLGIEPDYFMPPYEWYNKKVVNIADELNQKTVSFTPGTKSNADYTWPELQNYVSSKMILESIYTYETKNNLNGFHLLIHPGTDPKRKDKFYLYLDELINYLKEKKYRFNKFK